MWWWHGKNPNNILFQLGQETAIVEESQTELRLGLMQILDETDKGETYQMCASANMAIYVKEMTKLEVNGNLVTLQSGSF